MSTHTHTHTPATTLCTYYWYSYISNRRHAAYLTRRCPCAAQSPANESIGERPCANGDRCLANFIAHVRYGKDSNMAFTCKEFLLPSQYRDFKDGKGLPARRQKCVLCSRYFQNYVYIIVSASQTRAARSYK